MRAAVILLIESVKTDTDSLGPALQKAGYDVATFTTGRAALAYDTGATPGLIVFDARLMRTSGVRVCQRLRARWPAVPLLHCRAAGAPLDEAIAADAYLQMPFTPRKVLNRARLLLPPTRAGEAQSLHVGPYALYFNKRTVTVEGRGEFALTPKMLGVLQVFLTHPNVLISRSQLMQTVWDTDYIGDTRTLDVHIRWLREIIEADPARPVQLRTVRGKGYIFNLATDGER